MSGDRVPVDVDDIWPADTEEDEGVVVNWFVSEGSEVAEGDVLCEIQVEKVDADVPATVGGTLDEIVIPEDGAFRRGDTLAYIA